MAKPATKPKVEAFPADQKPAGPGDNSVTPEQLKAYYRDMLLIRRVEERAGQLYGMGTSVERASAVTELYRHGAAFGIPGEQVDGMDVLAVRQAGAKAVEHSRSGQGPYVLEMQTYRYRGHSMSDPAKYRTKEEVDKYRNERDPIDHVRKILIDEKMADEATLKAVDADVRKIINDAAEYAQHSPEPDPSELWTDVLVEG